MRILVEVLTLFLGAAAVFAATAPVTLVLPSGEVVQCTTVLRILPAAVQFVDENGKARIILKKDIPRELAPQIIALAPTTPLAPPRPTPGADVSVAPSIFVDVVPIGSKSSTTYAYYDWYGQKRTTNSGATYEVRMELLRPKTLPVKVITLVGANYAAQDLTLDSSRANTIRIETTGSRTIANDL